MSKVCFIVGLAGSGKTHTATQMAWFRHFDENFANSLTDHQELIQLLLEGKDCAVSELQMMFAPYRAQIENWLREKVPGIEIQYVCFENNLEAANQNCEFRTNKGDPEGHKNLNRRCSPSYTIPDGAKVLSIYRIPC